MKFNTYEELNVQPKLKQAIQALGYVQPTEIQSHVIPFLLEKDSADLIALAQTGSGKTAAFGIPIAEKIDAQLNSVQALILAPTRELAAQIQEVFNQLLKPLGIYSMTIYGGSSYMQQKSQLKRNPQVLIATPGRLVDLLNQRVVRLNNLKILVLDEADRMLSMGFEEDLRAILKATHSASSSSADSLTTRASCQTWLFSATMSPGIRRILNDYLNEPEIIELAKSNNGVSSTLEHRFLPVKPGFRAQALLRLLASIEDFYGIIFCQTKLDVAEVEKMLIDNGIACISIHGDKMQKERERILKSLKSEHHTVLVATDVAARGIDVKNLTHVVHYSLPREIESYIHRSGRTGRNGEKGMVVSIVESRDFGLLNKVQRMAKINMTQFELKSGQDLMKKAVREELMGITGKISTDGKFENLSRVCEEMITELKMDELSAAEVLAGILSQNTKNMDLYSDFFVIRDFNDKPLKPKRHDTRKGGNDRRRSFNGDKSQNRGGRHGRNHHGRSRDERARF